MKFPIYDTQYSLNKFLPNRGKFAVQLYNWGSI
jgi:hypothetical protein